MEEENAAAVAAMSSQDIEEERADLMRKYGAGLLDNLAKARSRKSELTRASEAPQTPSASAETKICI